MLVVAGSLSFLNGSREERDDGRRQTPGAAFNFSAKIALYAINHFSGRHS
jgi:hypothetical protein